MSSYVRRTAPDGRENWVGPIRSAAQAEREAESWRAAGQEAVVEPSTPEIRAEVRAWELRLTREALAGRRAWDREKPPAPAPAQLDASLRWGPLDDRWLPILRPHLRRGA